MHALAGQRIEIDRQRGRQGFAFAGAHLGNFAVVQRHAAQHLHVEVPHLHDALAALADHGKGFREDFIQGLALGDTVYELPGLGTQLLIIERFKLRLQCIDLLDGFTVGFEQAVVAAAENFGQDIGSHKCEATLTAPMSGQCGRNPY